MYVAAIPLADNRWAHLQCSHIFGQTPGGLDQLVPIPPDRPQVGLPPVHPYLLADKRWTCQCCTCTSSGRPQVGLLLCTDTSWQTPGEAASGALITPRQQVGMAM